MAKPLRIAVLQAATGPDIGQNHGRIARAIEEAAHAGADLLVTPECILSDYFPAPDADYARLRDLLKDLASHAASARIGLCVGSAMDEGGRIYNRAFLYDRGGCLLGTYDKTALTGFPDATGGDTAIFAPGERLEVLDFEGVPVAMQICYDMRFPENWRILRAMGARLVLHLVAASGGGEWKRPVLAGTMACRAAETGLFIASANDCRPPQMMVSTIVDPDGLVLAEARPDSEQLLIADLDLNPERSWFADSINGSRPLHLWRRPEYRRRLLDE